MSDFNEGLELKLLGDIQIRFNGSRVVVLTSKKPMAILCFLAMHSSSQTRAKIASLLWTDTRDEFARANLRQALSLLRKNLEDRDNGFLCGAQGELWLASESFNLDVAQFKHCCSESSTQFLEQATALYQGEFLEGFISGAPAFDEWVEEQRKMLSLMHEEALNKLLSRYEETGLTKRSIEIGNRLLKIDPLSEKACCSLMRAYSVENDTSKIVRCFQQFENALQSDLGTLPRRETRMLYNNLLAADRERQESAKISNVRTTQSKTSGDVVFSNITATPWDSMSKREQIETGQRHYNDFPRFWKIAAVVITAVVLSIYNFSDEFGNVTGRKITDISTEIAQRNSKASTSDSVAAEEIADAVTETDKLLDHSEGARDFEPPESLFDDDPEGYLSFLFDGGDINDSGAFDAPPLFRAVKAGNLKMARLLIAMGADPEIPARRGKITPLHQAASLGFAEMINLLTEAGANPNARNFISRTPLFHAATAGHLAAIDALVAGGAVVDRRERVRGTTALLAAIRAGKKDAAERLLWHGADINVEAKRLCSSRFGAAFYMASLEDSLYIMQGTELLTWVSQQGGKGADDILTHWKNRGGPSAADEATYRSYYDQMIRELTRIVADSGV